MRRRDVVWYVLQGLCLVALAALGVARFTGWEWTTPSVLVWMACQVALFVAYQSLDIRRLGRPAASAKG